MSLLESKIEEFEFKNRALDLDLDIRIKDILCKAEELDSALIDISLLRNHFKNLKSTYPENSPLLVNEIIALVYLACRRSVGEEWFVFGRKYTWNIIPRNVQLKAGVVLCDEIEENRFIRARTGEGKTFISLFPIALYALYGSVHIMTSNDYLAKRDQAWLGPVLMKLGITSTFLSTVEKEKAAAYSARAVFGSDKEFSFDFLRDSIRPLNKAEMCSKRDYIIVDEADHIMLDELQTPIILSALSGTVDQAVPVASNIIAGLLERQKEYIGSIKKLIENGKNEFEDLRDFLRLVVQVKYSGFEKIWLKALFSKNPEIEKEVKKFENTYLLDKGFHAYIENDLLFIVDKSNKWCALTEKGMAEIENNNSVPKDLFIIPDYEGQAGRIRENDLNQYFKRRKLKELFSNEEKQLHMLSSIQNALYAQTILEKDVDYIVTEVDRLELVNPSTGRSDPLKKYQKALSQALEYKEKVKQTESDIVVTVTSIAALLNSYFRICAMSGTITPNQKELCKIYSFHSFDIPTYKPPIVKHFATRLFPDKKNKRKSILKEIRFNNNIGRPVLMGTSSVKESEELARLLKENNIEFSLLNAKNERKEAEIISKAGELNAVTISTNMAGRGVDIKVSVDDDKKVSEAFVSYVMEIPTSVQKINLRTFSRYEYDLLLSSLREAGLQTIICKSKKILFKNEYVITLSRGLIEEHGKPTDKFYEDDKTENENRESIKNINIDFNAGLLVIGDELGQSDRINTQLRGRTGRQGGPGSSRFYASLDDNLINDSETASILCGAALNLPFENMRFVSYIMSKIKPAVKNCALKLSQLNGEKRAEFEREENLFYGSIVEIQRKHTSDFRESIIAGTIEIDAFIHNSILSVIEEYLSEALQGKFLTNTEYEKFKFCVEDTFNTSLSFLDERLSELSNDLNQRARLIEISKKHLIDLYEKRKRHFKKNVVNETIKKLLIGALDRNWIIQINNLEYLKDTAFLFSYAGKDPKELYIRLAHDSFKVYISMILKEFLHELYYYPLPDELSVSTGKIVVSGAIQELLK